MPETLKLANIPQMNIERLHRLTASDMEKVLFSTERNAQLLGTADVLSALLDRRIAQLTQDESPDVEHFTHLKESGLEGLLELCRFESEAAWNQFMGLATATHMNTDRKHPSPLQEMNEHFERSRGYNSIAEELSTNTLTLKRNNRNE